MKLKHAALAFTVALVTLTTACGGAEQPASATGGDQADTSSAVTSPSRVASTSVPGATSTSSSAAADFAQRWSDKLQAVGDWPTPTEPIDVVQQHTDLTKLQTEFLLAASMAGVKLTAYPEIMAASDRLTEGLTDFDSVVCGLAQPKSADAFTCNTKLLTSKLDAKTLGLTLSSL